MGWRRRAEEGGASLQGFLFSHQHGRVTDSKVKGGITLIEGLAIPYHGDESCAGVSSEIQGAGISPHRRRALLDLHQIESGVDPQVLEGIQPEVGA